MLRKLTNPFKNLPFRIWRNLGTHEGKIYSSCADALYDMKDGVTVAMGGFGIWGIP